MGQLFILDQPLLNSFIYHQEGFKMTLEAVFDEINWTRIKGAAPHHDDVKPLLSESN